ncbi:MAG: LysM peptidoglycan-binding domain-containing protein [Dysgonomonas sp.]
MKFKYILFWSFVFIIGFTNNLSAFVDKDYNTTEIIAEAADDILIHTVEKGETVYSIAAAYRTTVQEIYRLNPSAEKGIKAGDKLKIQRSKITGYSNHQIDAKETLYSVSRMYRLSVEDIKKANPGLDESNFKIGKTIKIPIFGSSSAADVSDNRNVGTVSMQKYQVQKGETLYSIGKAYDISVSDLMEANPSVRESGLKEGMELTIPGKGIQNGNVTNLQSSIQTVEAPYAYKGETVRVGILLPFLDDKGDVSTDKLTEYYEGFLLAVKTLKEKGLNAEIYTFDIGSEKNTKKLESLMGTNEMKNLHLIVGGVSKQQIDVLTKFSKKTGIKYMIPFGSSNEVNINPTLFQITSSHTSLYAEVISAFKSQYKNYNIVFVSEAGSNNDKSDFVDELKKELAKSNISFQTTTRSSNLTEDITSTLDTSKKNVFIPTSSAEATLRRIINAINSIEAENLTLFGYPEWQIYAQHRNALHKYDTRIYSIFFVDDQQKEVQAFLGEYKTWYNKDLINSYPKYGYLGYDMGLYFLTALNRYGSSFENSLNNMKVPTLQSAIHFDQVNGSKGGFINNGIYFVHYKVGTDIEKTDVSN